MKKLILLLLLALLALASVHSFYSYRKYNVILITTDTLRADYLSCYNADAGKTQNFDRLARESVLFERTYSTIPITLAAHTAILTSHAPHNLALFNNGDMYEGRYPLVSKLLAEHGYDTAAFISLGVLKGEFGLRNSFQTYEDQFDEQLGRYYKTANEVNALALPWLQKHKDHRFFAWIHYSDPHEPYVTVDAPPDTEVLINGKSAGKFCLAKKEKITLPFTASPGATKFEFRALAQPGPKRIQEADSNRYLDPRLVLQPKSLSVELGSDFQKIRLSNGSEVQYFAGTGTLNVRNTGTQPLDAALRFTGGVWGQRVEEVRANYEAEVQFLDQQLGILLDQLKSLSLMDRTMIVLTSDHGEGLKSHGYLGHVGNLHDEVIHVPLLIHYPGLGREGIRVSNLVSHLEITPTILDLLHFKNHQPMEGASLKYYISRSPIDRLFADKVERPYVYTETYTPEAPNNSFSLVGGNMSFIFTSPQKWELFDTSRDPNEKKNIARLDPSRFQSEPIARFRRKLEEYSRNCEELHSRRKQPQLDEQQKDMLIAMEYLNQGKK